MTKIKINTIEFIRNNLRNTIECQKCKMSFTDFLEDIDIIAMKRHSLIYHNVDKIKLIVNQDNPVIL